MSIANLLVDVQKEWLNVRVNNIVLDKKLRVGGTSLPGAGTLVDFSSTDGAVLIPRMTTAQKNALSATSGMILYDTTLNAFQVNEAGTWVSIVGPATSQTLSNKNFIDNTCIFIDDGDATKRVRFENSSATTGTIMTINPAQTANRNHTIPDSGADSSFIMSNGAQTINGVKTFSNGLNSSLNLNQINLGTGNALTISAATPFAGASNYVVPDVGTNSTFILAAGAQTLGGVKTFTNGIVFGGGATNLNHYETATLSTTFKDASTGVSGSLTLNMTRVGNSVTMVIPQISFTSGAAPLNKIISNTAIATNFRPANLVFAGAPPVAENAVPSIGTLTVDSAGIINIYKATQANWTNAVGIGTSFAFSIHYLAGV